MKRRNTRKCESFDYIKVSPKKTSTHGNSIILIDHQYKCLTPQIQTFIKEKHHLQLPKIHALHPSKLKKFDKQTDTQYTTLENKLLLLGYQYRSDNENLKDTKDEKKEKDYLRKKMLMSKESFMHKRIFAGSVLSSFGIGQVVLEKRKLQVYVQQGNNSRMVKEVLRKRPQVNFVNDKKQANLVWTRFCDYQVSKLLSKCHEQKITHSIEHHHQDEHQIQYSKSIKLLQEIVSHPHKSSSNKQLEIEHVKQRVTIHDLKIHNHLTSHYEISDKKSLFSNLQKYCEKNRLNIFQLVPVTYEISKENMELNAEISDDGFWFIKPGEDTNRGNGISIALGRAKIKQQVNNLLKIGKTALVQQYIDPLLYRNRKFDIRCYTLVLSFKGELKAYWYKQGYIRTCSKEFNYDINDLFAHLTNDAVQKKSNNYGKYEQSNKLSFGDMEAYLKTKDINFKDLCTEMKKLVYHSIKSVQSKLKGQKHQFNFQIFGYDFLIDKKGKVWLIQINTNPCLEFTGSLTSRVIGHMMDNSLKIALDPLLGNQSMVSASKDDYSRIIEDNKYECLI